MKKYLFTLLLFAFISGLFAYINNTKSLKTTNFANITVAQALDTILARINDPWFVILDVRTPAEYANLHLEEGVNIDFYDTHFADTLATLNKDKIYLLHCASGGRSGQVFTMMQNLNFQNVYNMLGGTNAWVNAIYPTVTTVAPQLGFLCDTVVNFDSINLNETDSVKITITNAANDTLKFSGITDLSGTSFSSNFDTSVTLLGARDYSFYMYYSPDDLLPDSVVFTVQSNGDSANFVVHGTAVSVTNINQSALSDVSVFNDINNKQIIISSNLPQKISYSLYDIGGRLIVKSDLSNLNLIDYSAYKNGIYFLRISTLGTSKTYKLPLFY